MPVTTILQHAYATEREIRVKIEAEADAHMSNNEENLISGHIPVEPNLDTTESFPPINSRVSQGETTAPAISPGPFRQPKQQRKASTSKRRRKTRSPSAQIASETGHHTFVSDTLPSSEPVPLGASFFAPFGMSSGTVTYEQSPKGTWEPQLAYCRTPLAYSSNCTDNAYTENALNLYHSHSIPASPSTNLSSGSGQRSSFASSSGQTSPSSSSTAQSCPRGYESAQKSLEDQDTTVCNNTPSTA